MATKSYKFNLTLLNVLLNLVKGSRLLGEYSKKFKVFGFNVYGIEQNIASNDKDIICPELILISETINNTLFIESTIAKLEYKINPNNTGGKNQLDRYNDINKEYVVNSSGISLNCLSSLSIPIIVDDEKITEYIEFLSKTPQYSFPLMIFQYDRSSGLYSLELKLNQFSDKLLNDYFIKGIYFRRFNEYICFDLANVHETLDLFYEACLKELIEKLKNDNGQEIRYSDLVKDILSDEIWYLLSDKCKHTLSDNAKNCLTDFKKTSQISKNEIIILNNKSFTVNCNFEKDFKRIAYKIQSFLSNRFNDLQLELPF